MGKVITLSRAEFVKMRHTFLIPLHILLPLFGSGVFLAYYRISIWNELSQASAFLEIVGVSYPFLISIVSARTIELEEENHFQTFLGVSAKKGSTLSAKWLSMQLLSLAAIVLAVLSFAVGHHYFLGKNSLDVEKYLIIASVMWISTVPVYLEHIFLNLRFSKAVSIGIGSAQFLISALMLTGLGDGRWQYFPCTWPARESQLLFLFYTKKSMGTMFFLELKTLAVSGIWISIMICAIVTIWFHYYEGRQWND